MKKILTFAVVAGSSLALAACGGKKEEAPAEPAEAEMMAPAEEATPAADEAADPAAAAAEDLDPTGNPIRPAEAPAAEATPAAE